MAIFEYAQATPRFVVAFFQTQHIKLGCGFSARQVLSRPKSSQARKGSAEATGTGSKVTAGVTDTMLAAPTGSATGNPRNKVGLTPGHSLLDWIRLGKSGKDLTGVGGRQLDVTTDELGRHCKQEDVWTAVRG